MAANSPKRLSNTPDRLVRVRGAQTMDDRLFKILLVEDTRLDAERARDMLKEARAFRFDLTHVETLSEAKRFLDSNAVDIILLDLFLPDTQGTASLVPLRAVALNFPIVVTTGLVDEEVAIQALQYGAQDYLVKSKMNANLLTRSIRHAVERKRLELRVRKLALYDSLTDLPNRALFKDRLDRALATALRHQRVLSLLVLDLDNFRTFNDTFGYSTGDKILKETANRLTSTLRSSCFIHSRA